MRYTEKEHKKLHKLVNDKKDNKTTNKTEVLPAWFNQEQSVVETTDEDIEVMDNILKELV